MSELTTFESEIESVFSHKNVKRVNGALKILQDKAFHQFEQLGIPKAKSEAYKFTPIARILEKNIDLEDTIDTHLDNVVLSSHFYPIKEANHLVFMNGAFKPDNSLIVSNPEDLTIRKIDAESYLDESRLDGLGKLEMGQADAFYHLNLGLFDQGLFLATAKKSNNLPVFIYHFIDSAVKAVFPRIYIHGAALSALDVYEKTIFFGTENTLVNHVLEVTVSENASVHFTKLQNYPKHIFAIESIYGTQARDSRFYTNTYSFKGGLIRNNIGISIDGENCEAHMNGLYQVAGDTHVDNNTAVDHRKPNSYSNELYKGIIDEHARAVFNGRIYVRPDAQKTNAFQSNNNILLSDTAIINTKPQLEIWADDVKCSHGCTTGQLDEEAIFYIQSRGIDKKQAKSLLLNAFANETLQSVKEEVVKAEIEHLILNKLGQ